MASGDGLSQHASIRIPSAVCGGVGWSGHRLGGERPIGHSAIDENPRGFFNRVHPQGGVPLHAQALFLAESNRDLVFDLGEKVTEEGEFL